MKLFITSLALVGILYSCSHKTTPMASTTTTTTTTTTTAPVTSTPVATTPPVKTESAEVIAGKGIYTSKCTRCHEAKPVNNWNAQQWVPIMDRMAPKAGLNANEKANVTAYVNFYARS